MGEALDGFICKKCGERHEGIPDLGYALPLPIAELSADERAQRAKISDDFCTLDEENFFVRGVLELPIIGQADRFGLGVWSSLRRINFQRYVETFEDKDQSKLGSFFGWFSNRLPNYPDTFLLKCEVHPRDGNKRPSITLQPTDHPLSLEERFCIELEKVLELLSGSYH